VAVLVGRNLVRHGLRQTGAQRRMGPSAVIVDCPIPNRHLQMALVEGNQEVQTLATKAAAQSFAYGVRLGGSHRRWQNPYPQIGKAWSTDSEKMQSRSMDDEALGVAARQRFPELLQCPFRRGMGRGVVVENLAGSNLYHEQDKEGAEGGRDHHEEVAGHHDLGMVADQVSQLCFGSGVRTGLCLRRYLPTVRGEIPMVSFRFNSLVMRSSPQVGFSAAIS